MAGEREHPQNPDRQAAIVSPHVVSREQESLEVEKSGSIRTEFEEGTEATAEGLGLEYQPTEVKGIKEEVVEKLGLRGYLVRGREEDIKHFNRILNMAYHKAYDASAKVGEEVKKHPKIVAGIAGAAFAVAALALVEKKKRGEGYQIGLDDGAEVE